MDEKPMSCPEEMQTRLSRYVDGELTPEERGAVEEHVSGCPSCQDLLSLFQKNENLMAGALTTDAFGDAVISSVLQTLRKEDPPEARPVEETFGDWLRARPLLPLAAAALFVVGLIVVLNASHRSRMSDLHARVSVQEKTVVETKARIEKAETASLEMARAFAHRSADYEKIIRDLRTDIAILSARHHTIVYAGVFEDRGLSVKASFDPKGFDYYDLFRRQEGDPEYVQVNGRDERLDKAEYVDRGVKSGQVYWYKFRAYRKGIGGWIESAPVQFKVPTRTEIRLEDGIQVWCQDVSAPRDMAKFLLERTVKGQKVSHVCYTNLGESIGDVVDLPGVGRIDFRTGLTLGKISEKQQTLGISYAEPLYDETGKEVIERIENGRVVIPASRQHSGALNLKTNDLIEMQPQGPPGQPAVTLWKGSWMVVPAVR
jgi:hypothetical protein